MSTATRSPTTSASSIPQLGSANIGNWTHDTPRRRKQNHPRVVTPRPHALRSQWVTSRELGISWLMRLSFDNTVTRSGNQR